jgi:chromosome segregation ATPase
MGTSKSKQPKLPRDQRQLIQANQKLEQVEQATLVATEQLVGLQTQIEKHTRDLKSQVASFNQKLSLEMQELQGEHDKVVFALKEDVADLTKTRDTLFDIKTRYERDIEALIHKQDKINSSLNSTIKLHNDRVESLEKSAQMLEVKITARHTRLNALEHKVGVYDDKLTRIKEKVAQTEQGYITRIEILQRREKEAAASCEEILVKLQEYTTTMDHVSEADTAHAEDLKARENDLVRKIRALNEERIEFAAQKRRFEQTKQLQ